jgi:hypothetical protein
MPVELLGIIAFQDEINKFLVNSFFPSSLWAALAKIFSQPAS